MQPARSWCFACGAAATRETCDMDASPALRARWCERCFPLWRDCGGARKLRPLELRECAGCYAPADVVVVQGGGTRSLCYKCMPAWAAPGVERQEKERERDGRDCA